MLLSFVPFSYTSEFVFAFFGQKAEVHRTGNIGTLNSKPAEVNGTKPKSLRASPEMPYRQQKNRARKTSLLGSQFVYIGVFSNDFAAVDVREELCYHSRPEKGKIRRGCEKQVTISLGLQLIFYSNLTPRHQNHF